MGRGKDGGCGFEEEERVFGAGVVELGNVVAGGESVMGGGRGLEGDVRIVPAYAHHFAAVGFEGCHYGLFF